MPHPANLSLLDLALLEIFLEPQLTLADMEAVREFATECLAAQECPKQTFGALCNYRKGLCTCCGREEL